MKKDTVKKNNVEKATKHSIAEKTKSIVQAWYDMPSREPKLPIPEHIIQKIADELIDWAYETPDAIVIGDFFKPRRIYRQAYEHWRKIYPFFNDAMVEALLTLGERREKMAFQMQASSRVWEKTARLYDCRMDKQWHADQEFMAKLKLDSESNEPKYIIIKDFPDAKSE